MRIFCILMISASYIVAANPASTGRQADNIWGDYVKAVGGQAAVDRLTSRETVVDVRHSQDLTFYWEKPNKVLSVSKKERTGYDGAHAWTMSAKNKVKKLGRGSELTLEIEANPLRYVHIKDFHSELDNAPTEEIDGEKMDVILAPNKLAATKLYFDATTHLLRRVEEKGEISAYYANTFDYSDYRQVDGVRMPYHIVHTTTEPQGVTENLRIKNITHNITLQPEIFSKPMPGQVVLGGKR